ncbi:MAG: hypothetical protein ACRCS9_13925 [Hyphomicrobium sp.]
MTDQSKGWGFFNDLDKRQASEAATHDDARRRAGQILLQAFTTEAGALALDLLQREIVDKPSLPDIGAEMMLYQPETFTMYVAWNEAQKALVRKILKLMDEAKVSPVPQGDKS